MNMYTSQKKKKIEREEKRPEFLFKIYMHTASPYTWLNVDFLNSQTEKCNVNLLSVQRERGRIVELLMH